MPLPACSGKCVGGPYSGKKLYHGTDLIVLVGDPITRRVDPVALPGAPGLVPAGEYRFEADRWVWYRADSEVPAKVHHP